MILNLEKFLLELIVAAINLLGSYIRLSSIFALSTPKSIILAPNTMRVSDRLDWINSRSLLPAIVIPVILNVILLFASQWKFYKHEVVLFYLTLSNLIAFVLTFWWSTRSLDALKEKRQWAIEALHLQKERFKLALEGSDSGLWDWNIVTGEVYLSHQCFQMSGYTEGELVNNINTFIKLIHREDLPKVKKLIESHLKGKTSSYSAEFRIRKKSGEWMWVLNCAKVVEWDHNGEALRMIGTHKDISDRKQIEAELLESKNLLEIVLESISDKVFVKDLNLKMLHVNTSLAMMFGKQKSEIIGKNPDEIHPIEVANIISESERRIIQSGVGETVEEEVPILNGEKRIFLVIKNPLRDRNKNIIGVVGIACDITDRKKAEQKIQAQEQFLRSIWKGVDYSIYVVDVLENGEFRYKDFNPVMARLSPIPVETLQGKKIAEALPPHIANTVQQRYQKCIEAGTTISEEECLIFNGAEIWRLLSMTPVRDSYGRIYQIVVTGIDITERKQAEKALIESNNLLESVLESTSDMIAVKDLQGRYVEANSACLKIIRKSKAEAIGKTFAEIFLPNISLTDHPEQVDRNLKESDRRIILSGVSEITEEEIRDPQGKKRLIMMTRSPWRDREGKVIGLVIIGRDITHRKEAEEAIRIKEQTLRTIIDNSPIWIWMANTSGQIQFVNKTLCQDTAIPESKWLSATHYAEIIGPQQAAIALASDAACLAQENTYHQEETIQFADGKLRTIDVIKAKLKNSAGEIIGLIGLGVDITEQKKAREKLAASEAKFRQLAQQEALLNRLANQIRNSLNINTILETAVHEIKALLKLDRCLFILYVPNTDPPAWQVTYEAKNSDLNTNIGYYPTEFTGGLLKKLSHFEIDRVDNISNITDPVNRQFFESLGFKSILNFPLQTHSGRIGVLSCIQHTNYHCWQDEEIKLLQSVCAQLSIAISQAELYEQTRKTAQLSQAQAEQISLAMSQLQKTQTQLIQAEKMSSLGAMVAGIAHEINNPVSFIFGNLSYAEDYASQIIDLVQLYQQEYPEPSANIRDQIESIDLDFLLEDFPKILKSMQVGATRIRDIVKSLRIFSHLDESEMKEVDIHEGIDSTLMILENRLKAQGHRAAIEVRKEYGNLPLLECYAGQLNQVFMNILANAIDALQNSQISHPIICIHTEIVENYATIEITDNGSGIPDEIKQRIFDPFFTTKPIGAGTGMGLAISHSIVVEKHKGKLTCNSISGEGTKFIIEIPLRQISS